MKAVLLVLLPTLWLAGCARPAATLTATPSPPASATTWVAMPPKFESVLTLAHDLGSGKGTSRYTSARYDNDQPFRAVENYASTVTGAAAKLEIGVRFTGRRGGKDWYALTYTLTEGGSSQTTTREVGYDGKRTALVEDGRCTLVLQPPGPEDEPAAKK